MSYSTLITGISGYLGRKLTAKFLELGWSVRGLDIQKWEGFNNQPVEFVKGDIQDYETIKSACKSIDVIFHLVGLMPQAKAKSDLMYAVNVKGTENIANAAAEEKVKKIVYLSSCEVYGDWHNAPMTEKSPAKPVGDYGRNKIDSEKILFDYHKKYGISVINLRPSTLVGADMTDYLFLNFVKMMLKSPVMLYPGDGNNKFQMSGINDVVDVCVLLTTREDIKAEIFNIGADDVLPMKEQMKEIFKKTGLKRIFLPLPQFPTKPILKFLTSLGISPLVPDHFEVMWDNIIMDCSKIKKILNWQPKTSNVDMIVEAINSYRNKII